MKESSHKHTDPSPLVSVIMTVYNGERYLSEAIESILNQTYANFELLIFNDGSTDRSLELMRSFEDKRIKVFDDKKNKGAYPRLNQGIEQAQGSYIAIMDADDIALPQRLERQLNFLESHPEIAVVGTQVQLLIEPHRRLLRPKKMAITHSTLLPFMLFYCPFVHPTVMMRATVTKQYAYPNHSHITQDFGFWIHLLEKYQGANLKEVLLYYRIHQHNSSSNHSTTLNNLEALFEKQFNKLGLPFSKAEMRTHLSLSDSNPTLLHLEQLKAIKNWLKKLALFNQQRQIFHSSSFSKTLQLVLLESWLWKVRDPWDYWNVRESPLFKSGISWRDRWRLLRSFFYRLRQ